MDRHWKFLKTFKRLEFHTTLALRSLPESCHDLCRGTGEKIFMASFGWGGVQLIHQLHGSLWGRLQRGVTRVLNVIYTWLQQIDQALNLPLFHSKSETNEMQDLVQMMTQTLRMDARDIPCEQESSWCNLAILPEFKLNRKYRDTLMLHGKIREGGGDFHPSDVCSGCIRWASSETEWLV